MDQLYRQQIIDNYNNPKNFGKLAHYNGHSKVFNKTCGDEIEVYLDIQDGKIQDIKYDAMGCAISVAAASLLSEEIKGLELSEVEKLDDEYIQELIGTKLTSSRIKCAMLSLDGVKKAIEKNKV